MKVRVQQLNPVIGDIKGNAAAIKKTITEAQKAGIDILLLPELAVCGYLPMDFLERPAFREQIYQANRNIAEHAQETAVIFGTITPNKNQAGKPCYNSALFAYQREVKSEIHKSLLPTYNVYDELRYFEPDRQFKCIDFKDRKIGVTICEDIWCNYGNNPDITYDINPVQELADRGAEAIFNLSASPFDKSKHRVRVEMIRKNIERTGLPVFYANQVGGNTDLISDGDSMVIDDSQNIIARAPLFEEAHLYVNWEENKITAPDGAIAETSSKQKRIFSALCFGLKEYLQKSGAGDTAIIGLSGGIDSALAACIAKESLGAEKVTCVAMPSEFSTEGSVTDARKLAENLGIELEEIPVKSIYEEYLKTLKPQFKDTSFGTAEENLQARIRGVVLMALSNKFGGLVLNTGNKSEAAVGYSTLYGDMTGAISVIGDLFKTEVYQLARWLNDNYWNDEVIPQSILTKAPSAELRPDQKDSDRLPPYQTLDPILKLYLEKRRSVDEITEEGFDKSTVQKTINLIHQSEYKRKQAPPALKTSYTSLGNGLRWPVVSRQQQ